MKTVGMTREGYPIEVDPIGQLQKFVRDNGYELEIGLNKQEEIHFLQDEVKASRINNNALVDIVSRYEFKWLTINEIFQVASGVEIC
jgi:hypothetical protein